ncbi:MAG: tripartite tricarboxylate transporter permease, partial [Syntrophales bacterium]|nr:tripartite tricarboxylate transporter permease [Syntrophales bacterium]
LAPVIVLFTTVGVYSVQNQTFDIFSMLFFAALGYGMRKLNFDPAPLPLAFVLEPMVENSLRQSLLMSGGTPMIFLSRPISGTLLAVLFILVVGQAAFSIRRRIREK